MTHTIYTNLKEELDAKIAHIKEHGAGFFDHSGLEPEVVAEASEGFIAPLRIGYNLKLAAFVEAFLTEEGRAYISVTKTNLMRAIINLAIELNESDHTYIWDVADHANMWLIKHKQAEVTKQECDEFMAYIEDYLNPKRIIPPMN